MRIQTTMLLLLIAIQPSPTTAREVPIDLIEAQRELALLQCLQTNYKSIGSPITANDWSNFSPRYQASKGLATNFDWQSTFRSFVDTEVQDYYKEELSVKAEGHQPPFTHIFSKCMAFYKSEKLHRFLRSQLKR